MTIFGGCAPGWSLRINPYFLPCTRSPRFHLAWSQSGCKLQRASAPALAFDGLASNCPRRELLLNSGIQSARTDRLFVEQCAQLVVADQQQRARHASHKICPQPTEQAPRPLLSQNSGQTVPRFVADPASLSAGYCDLVRDPFAHRRRLDCCRRIASRFNLRRVC